MLFPKLILRIASLVLFVSCPPAFASPLLKTSGNKLIGAQGVSVDGKLYDVKFLDGSCNSIFNGCDSSSFVFTTSQSAINASQALLDSVCVNNEAQGMFDDRPELTNGCITNGGCFIFTPFGTYIDGYNQKNSVILWSN